MTTDLSLDQTMQSFQKEIERYKPLLKQTTQVIQAQEVTNYPIFVVHRSDVQIGVPLTQADQSANSWSIHASSLEELSTKQVIQQDKIESFQQLYKSKAGHYCLFIVTDSGATFAFIPK